MRRVFVLASALILTGCGALFNGGPQSVMLTSAPNEAQVWVDGNQMGVTPIALDLKKSKDHTIIFKKSGYADQTVMLSRKISAGYVVLDVLGGVLPVVVDAATGSWYTLPNKTVNVTLSRTESAQAEGLVLQGKLTPEQLKRVKEGAPLSRVIPVTALMK